LNISHFAALVRRRFLAKEQLCICLITLLLPKSFLVGRYMGGLYCLESLSVLVEHTMKIPFNRPLYLGTEASAVAEVLAGDQLAAGKAVEACENWFSEQTGTARALMLPSCTHALELAALLADIGPGDEVIMPSYTFPSTANAFVLRGATPVFVDIRLDTCNLDESLIEAAITPRTRAIVPVH
jgi:dTDP-4-amino-4,6-dideoxygalactose transaminase